MVPKEQNVSFQSNIFFLEFQLPEILLIELIGTHQSNIINFIELEN